MGRVSVLTNFSEIKIGSWSRLHPLTPFLRGGLMLGGAIGVLIAFIWQVALDRGLSTMLGTRRDGEFGEVLPVIMQHPWVAALIFLAVTVATALVATLQWRAHWFRITPDFIEVRKGIVFRTSRRARRDRINTVGIRRPAISRLFGLARLDIQGAGAEAHLILAYLPFRAASDLRIEILGDSSQPSKFDSVKRPWRDVEVPIFRYLASLMFGSEAMFFLSILAGAVASAIVLERIALWLLPVAIAFGYLGFIINSLIRLGNFSVRSADGEVQVSFGLLTTSLETIPTSKIHALQISQPWVWRFFGWWRIQLNLASFSGSSEENTPDHTLLIPVADTAEMQALIELCLPQLDPSDKLTKIMAMLSKSNRLWRDSGLALESFVRPPGRAKFRIPFSYAVTGGAIFAGVIALRTGRLVARLSIFPLSRIQSSSIATGPWHKSLGLVYFSAETVRGPVENTLRGLDRASAHLWWERINSSVVMTLQENSSLSSRGDTP